MRASYTKNKPPLQATWRFGRAAAMIDWSKALVWGLWGAMVIAALLFVWRFAANAPFYDEWGMVPVLEGATSVDFAWLWAPHNAHRIPVPRLVLLGIYAVGGWNFRLAMAVNVLLLAAAAALLMRAVAANRGKSAYTDAFFPAMLLGWGHFENLLWGWQITQVFAVFLALALLAIVTRSGLRPVPATALASVLAVVALPLSGVPGLVYAPGMALWLAVVGGVCLRDGKKALGVALWVGGTVTLLLVPLYFLNLTTTVRGSVTLLPLLKTMAAFLSQGFGPATAAFAPGFYAFALFLGLFSVALVLSALRSVDSGVAGRAVALLLYLLGPIALALAVGVARTGMTRFPGRYFLLAAPALAWVYCACSVSGESRRVSTLRAVLATAAILSLAVNYPVGLRDAQKRAGAFAAFTQDLRARAPPSLLIARHQRTLLPYPEEGGAYYHAGLGRDFETLRRNKIGVFADLAQEHFFEAVPIAEKAVSETDGSAIIWSLKPALCIAGVSFEPPQRISAGPTNSVDDSLPYFTIEWYSAGSNFSRDRRYHDWPYVGQGRSVLWIFNEVASLRLHVDDPERAFSPPVLTLLLADPAACGSAAR
jgi:hypothetical protein